MRTAGLTAVDEHAVGGAEVRDRPAIWSGAYLGVPARDSSVVEDHVTVAAPADRAATRGDDQAAIADREQHALRPRAGTRLFERTLQARRSAVDHRLAVLFLFGGRLWALILAVGPDQPRLDAEFAERKPLVGVERDLQPRGQDQIFAAGMLEQVCAQLVDHVAFDALVAAAVLGREPHGVLIGRIYTRDRHGAVGIHLASELTSQLHWTDLGAKHTSENPLDEVCDGCLDALERVHLGAAEADRSRIDGQLRAMLRTVVQTGAFGSSS